MAESSQVVARSASTTAGWIGAGVFLTIPWVYRISTIAYAEGGLTFFLAATFVAWLAMQRSGTSWQQVLLCGLLAGSALACKYPGLVSVTVPAGLAVVWTAARRHGVPLPDRPTGGRFDVQAALRAAAVFSLGAAITFGPWALKNLVQTGNPVYPLGYTVFGGVDWTPELNAKWQAAHRAPVDLLREPDRIPADLWHHASDVAVNSTWQSPLVFAFAPLALFAVCRRRRPGDASAASQQEETRVRTTAVRDLRRPDVDWTQTLVRGLIVFAAWLFLTWWGLTHRIDRFWLPMLPIVCALAGIGGAVLVECLEGMFAQGRRVPAIGGALVLTSVSILATAYNLVLTTSSVSGFNAYLLDTTIARQVAMQQTPSIALLDARIPEGARVLLVGEAAVFDARFELRYNTVFDFELLQAWTTDDPRSLHEPDIPLKTGEQILANLRAEGITHVFVNWLEILRYREPGSYTYTEFISPRTLQKLVDLGVLTPVHLPAREGLVPFERLSPQKQQELQRWAPELSTTAVVDGESITAVRAYELYTVAEQSM